MLPAAPPCRTFVSSTSRSCRRRAPPASALSSASCRYCFLLAFLRIWHRLRRRRNTRTLEAAAAVACTHISHCPIERAVLALGRICLHGQHDVLRQFERRRVGIFALRVQALEPLLRLRDFRAEVVA